MKMSSKNEKNLSKMSTANVDKSYLDRLTVDGNELASPHSAVTVVHAPSMGERVRRYMKTPTLQGDLYANPDLWDPDDYDEFFDSDGEVVVSPHEERYLEALGRAREAYHEEQKAEQEALAAKQKAEQLDFQRRVREAMAAGDIPVPEKAE